MNSPRFGDWFLTYTGKQFYPMDPKAEDVCIEDIAHALSNICRFGGHCRIFYSVGNHSLIVSRICPPEFALVGLLHDATEAYCSDVVRPLKMHLPNYIRMEESIWSAVCDKFGIDLDLIAEVKHADNIALVTERRDVLPPLGPDWALCQQYEPLKERIVPLSPAETEQQFLARFNELTQ